LNLPGFSGVEVCRRLRQRRPDQKILICSATVTAEYETALRGIGVDHFLTKPYHPEALLSHIRRELSPSFSTVSPRAAG
ncbi:MAG TPA: response regulator, partial [Isosphaeraceae bacterium]|nr:response regulator [Isosphaeraceae bacterium]